MSRRGVLHTGTDCPDVAGNVIVAEEVENSAFRPFRHCPHLYNDADETLEQHHELSANFIDNINADMIEIA